MYLAEHVAFIRRGLILAAAFVIKCGYVRRDVLKMQIACLAQHVACIRRVVSKTLQVLSPTPSEASCGDRDAPTHVSLEEG